MHKIKYLLKPYEEFWLPLGFVMASLLLLFVGISPGVQKILHLKNEIRDVQEEVTALRQKKSILDSVDESFVRNSLQIVLSAVPSDKAIPSILVTTEQLAQNTGISLNDVSFVSPGLLASGSAEAQNAMPKKVNASIVSFVLNGQGSFDQMKSFFKNVVNIRRMLDTQIFEVSLSPAGQGTIRATMIAFYAPLPTSIGGLAETLPVLSDDDTTILQKLEKYDWLSQTVSLAPTLQQEGVGKTNPFLP